MSPTRKLLHYEWDEDKDQSNQRKHAGISFVDAISAFNDPHILSKYDPDHSISEERYIALGMDSAGQVLVISFTVRGTDENIRLISARRAEKKEEKLYFEMRG